MNKLKLMAFVCANCPMCIIARKYPEGGVARVVAKEKEKCPFCRAYDQLHEQGHNG